MLKLISAYFFLSGINF